MTRVAIALTFVAMLGCGKKDTEHASCKLGNVCENYWSKTPTYLEGRQKDCSSLQGVWAAEACPTQDLLGTCDTAKGEDWTESRWYYGGGKDPFTAATAEASCDHEFHGRWKAK